MAGKQIPESKRRALLAAIDAGDNPGLAAERLGLGRRTGYRYAAALRGGKQEPQPSAPIAALAPPQNVEMQDPTSYATMPSVRAYVEGDDRAMDGELQEMDARTAAQVMQILVKTRKEHTEGRSIDVGVVADLLAWQLDHSVSLFGDDPRLTDFWTGTQRYMASSQPILVDRMHRAGLNL